MYQNNTQYCLLLTIETGAYMWALLSPSNKRKAHFINSAIFICFFQFALFHFNFQAIFILLSSKLLKRTSFAIQFEIRLNVKFSTFQCWHHWRTLLSHCEYVIITNDCDIDSSQWVWLSFVYDSVSAIIFTRNEVTFSVSILLKNQLTTWSVLNCSKYPKKM